MYISARSWQPRAPSIVPDSMTILKKIQYACHRKQADRSSIFVHPQHSILILINGITNPEPRGVLRRLR